MFHYNWFEISAKANFEKYLIHLKDQPNLKFMEIGPFEGMATVWMLKTILTHPSSWIHVIDTFEGSYEHKEEKLDLSNLEKTFRENIEPYKEQVIIWKGTSQKILKKLRVRYQFDFIYIDGSHYAADVLEDAELAFPRLKNGGIMIFDDYGWDKYPNPSMNPRKGIDMFLVMNSNHLKVLSKEYQVVIRKNE